MWTNMLFLSRQEMAQPPVDGPYELLDARWDGRHRCLAWSSGVGPPSLVLSAPRERWALDERYVPRLQDTGLLPFACMLDVPHAFQFDAALLSRRETQHLRGDNTLLQSSSSRREAQHRTSSPTRRCSTADSDPDSPQRRDDGLGSLPHGIQSHVRERDQWFAETYQGYTVQHYGTDWPGGSSSAQQPTQVRFNVVIAIFPLHKTND